MKSKKIQKLVIFDFDGVLVNTLEPNFAINVEAQPTLTIEEFKSFHEGNIHEAILSGKKKSIPDFDYKFRKRTHELKIYDIFNKILSVISQKYILVIISSASTNTIKEILERDKATIYFADIFGSDVHKKKIVKIKMLLEKYNTTPENAVFITDTLGDIYEASESGVKSIAVTWGYHDEETLSKGKPFVIIDNPKNLISSIKKIL